MRGRNQKIKTIFQGHQTNNFPFFALQDESIAKRRCLLSKLGDEESYSTAVRFAQVETSPKNDLKNTLEWLHVPTSQH